MIRNKNTLKAYTLVAVEEALIKVVCFTQISRENYLTM